MPVTLTFPKHLFITASLFLLVGCSGEEQDLSIQSTAPTKHRLGFDSWLIYKRSSPNETVVLNTKSASLNINIDNQGASNLCQISEKAVDILHEAWLRNALPLIREEDSLVLVSHFRRQEEDGKIIYELFIRHCNPSAFHEFYLVDAKGNESKRISVSDSWLSARTCKGNKMWNLVSLVSLVIESETKSRGLMIPPTRREDAN
jgi:uncharacterized protein YcfL